MSPRTFFVGILALVCGVSASVGVNRLRQTNMKAKPVTVVVPVTKVAIKRGDEIRESMLTARHWPKELVPPGALLKKEDIVGKIAQVPFVKDEPIYSGKIGDSLRFSGRVKDGMRASTILTPNDSSFVAGLVEVDDKVDVLFTDNTDKEQTGGGSTTVLMPNIEILAIGQIIDPEESHQKDGKRMRSVTLAVTPDQSQKLVLAQEMGTLHLALRSEKDKSTAVLPPVTVKELRAGYSQPTIIPVAAEEAAEPVAPKQPNKISVRVIRGAFKSTAKLRRPPGEGSVYVNDEDAESEAPVPLAPPQSSAL
jgi:pilus assembly protein CpaB